MGRITATWTLAVNKPNADVFSYLADVRKHSEWSPKPYRIEGLSEGPVGKGTTFTSYGWIPKHPDNRNDVELTEYEPPSRLQFTSREKGQEFYNTYELSAEGSGTRVKRTMDMPKPPGFQGLVLPLFVAGFIKPAVMKGMRMMKANLEK